MSIPKKDITSITSKKPDLVQEIVKVTIQNMKQTRGQLTNVLLSQQKNFESIAADSLKKDSMEKYLSQIALYIARNDKLSKCFDSEEGKYSLIKAIDEAVGLGILPGVDAYITPSTKYIFYDGKSRPVTLGRLDPTAEGYATICCSEPNPIFRQIKSGIVRKSDKEFEIDKASGTVLHKIDHLKEEGSIVGAWIKCLPTNSKNENIVDYYSIKQLLTARERSPAWKSYKTNEKLYKECEKGAYPNAKKDKKGNYDIPNFSGKYPKSAYAPQNTTTPIWTTDEGKMCLKTIRKAVLKNYAIVKIGIQRSIDIFGNEEEVLTEKKPANIIDYTQQVLEKNIPLTEESNENKYFQSAAQS